MNDTNVIVIHPGTVVNQQECEAFVREIEDAIKTPNKTIVIDCEPVVYMNTRAIGAMVRLYKDLLQANGELRLVGPSPLVQKCLELSGIWPLLKVYRSVEEAKDDSSE